MPLSTLKISPSHGGIWTPSNTWFLGATEVLNPNGISIGAAVLQGSLVLKQPQKENSLLHKSHVLQYPLHNITVAVKQLNFNYWKYGF